MRISDWSSYVCSSDLLAEAVAVAHHQVEFAAAVVHVGGDEPQAGGDQVFARGLLHERATRTTIRTRGGFSRRPCPAAAWYCRRGSPTPPSAPRCRRRQSAVRRWRPECWRSPQIGTAPCRAKEC